MIQEQFVRELLKAAYPTKKVNTIEAVQFQAQQKSDAVVGKNIANGVFVGDLAIVPIGSAFTGTLTIAAANSHTTENAERIVKDGQPAVELAGLAFDGLTLTYAGTDAAGTKICNTIFTGYKVSFL